jgi:RimJ/RimL family protein N-acetyltransferase/ADP-ribose pyrophosphatase YjhB (NUDIX family)
VNYKDTLETKRLIMRPLTTDDFEAVHSWASHPANTRYMAWGPNDEGQTRGFLVSVNPGKDYAVALKETGTVIGSCGIYPDANGDTAELGWILHIDRWKQGYGTELGGELIRYGFEDLKLRRIFATCAAVNYGSCRVMERNGMRREATHKKSFWARVDKEWVEGAEYAILAEDYFAESGDRSTTGQSADCCYKTDRGVFRYRVGAMIQRDGKLLMATNSRDHYYYSVGGGVRFGETTEAALKREVSEEIGTDCTIGKLALVHENLFEERGIKYHELALFYFVDLPADAIVRSERLTDSGLVESFEWLPINQLDALILYPEVLKTAITRLLKPNKEVFIKNLIQMQSDCGICSEYQTDWRS